MFRLETSHLQASKILCQMLLPTLESQSVYIYYLKLSTRYYKYTGYVYAGFIRILDYSFFFLPPFFGA